jgi:hypothetical protein
MGWLGRIFFSWTERDTAIRIYSVPPFTRKKSIVKIFHHGTKL